MSSQYLQTPAGLLKIEADQRKLRRIDRVETAGAEAPNAVTEETAKQLLEYFDGKRREFSVFALAQGTPFQIAVWEAMKQIPYGHVVTYAQLAAAIGQPTACRAVANAVGKNPLLILQPCHRVVAVNGIGGFSAGLDAKYALLTVEGVKIPEKGRLSEKNFFTFPEMCDTIL